MTFNLAKLSIWRLLTLYWMAFNLAELSIEWFQLIAELSTWRL